MTGTRDVYIVATDTPDPLAQEVLTEAFEAEEVTLVFGEDNCLFSVRAEQSRVDVKFEARLTSLGWTPELLTGTPELRERLAQAHGFYRVSFEPGSPQPSIAAFESRSDGMTLRWSAMVTAMPASARSNAVRYAVSLLVAITARLSGATAKRLR